VLLSNIDRSIAWITRSCWLISQKLIA